MVVKAGQTIFPQLIIILHIFIINLQWNKLREGDSYFT